MEVLVSVLILSVGLLGLAGMQITGLRSVNNSTYYTQGTLALNDIIERIRANPTAVDANLFRDVDSDTTSAAVTKIDCATMPAPYCSAYYNIETPAVVNAATCTAAEMTTYDLNVWFCGEALNATGTKRANPLTDSLPGARVTIKCVDANALDGDDCSTGSRHDIVLTWTESNPDRTGNVNPSVTGTLSMTIQP